MRIVSTILLLLVLQQPRAGLSTEPKRKGQEASLTRAVFADGRLWMLSDAGALYSISEAAPKQREERLGEPVLDLCVSNGHPAALSCTTKDCKNWSLLVHDADRWTAKASVKADGDSVVSLNCTSEELLVVTANRVVDMRDSVRSVKLSEPLRRALVTSVYVGIDTVFVGLNAG